MAQGTSDREGTSMPVRPAGEVGGHTTQPGEQPDPDTALHGSRPAGARDGTNEMPRWGAGETQVRRTAQGESPISGDRPSLRMREPGQIDAPARERMVEQITASLAEMLARALRQSVEQAVEQALAGKAAPPPAQAAQRSAHQAELEKPKPAPSKPRTA